MKVCIMNDLNDKHRTNFNINKNCGSLFCKEEVRFNL